MTMWERILAWARQRPLVRVPASLVRVALHGSVPGAVSSRFRKRKDASGDFDDTTRGFFHRRDELGGVCDRRGNERCVAENENGEKAFHEVGFKA